MPEFEGGSEGGGGFSLTKKVGPLPMWAWAGGIVVVGYLAYRHFAGSSSATPTPSAMVTAPSDANGNLAPPTSLDVLSGQITGVSGQIGTIEQQLQGAMGTTSSSGVTTPDSGATGQVQALYQDFLGRAPENSQVTGYWANTIANAGVLSAFQQIENTPEAQQYAAANPGAIVAQQYQFLLGRTPTAAEVSGWASTITSPSSAVHEANAFAAASKNELDARPK